MKDLRECVIENQNVQHVDRLKGRRHLYLVGGTIRDILLGIEPKDFDFAVSGSGVNFAKTYARKIGGAFVLLSKEDDEARVVKDEIIYDFIGIGKKSINNDLERRDFTINAMAFDLDALQFLDPFKGLEDLDRGVVRPTTDTSLADDPLRVLRGFRFSLELDFKLSKNFFKYAQGLSFDKVAPERTGYEMVRIMAVPHSYRTILEIDKLGLFKEIFPEAKKIIEDTYLWGHSLSTYKALEELMSGGFFRKIEPEFTQYFSVEWRVPLMKLAGLLHDVAKPDTFLLKEGEVHFYGHDTKGAKIVQTLGYSRLKLSRSNVALLKKLVKEHMRLHLLATNEALTDRAIRRFFRDLGEEWFGAMMLAWADGYATAGWTRHLEKVFMRMIELKREDDAKPKIERLINGYDLIAIGLKPGPKFKIILQELFDMQLEGKITSKEHGLKQALEIDKRL